MQLTDQQLDAAARKLCELSGTDTSAVGNVNQARARIVEHVIKYGDRLAAIIHAVTSEQKEWPENQLRIGTQQKDEPWAKLRDMLEGCTMSSRGNVLTITVDDVDTCALDVMIAIDDLIGRRESKRMPSRKELDPLVIDPPQEWLDEPDASEQNDEVSE